MSYCLWATFHVLFPWGPVILLVALRYFHCFIAPSLPHIWLLPLSCYPWVTSPEFLPLSHCLQDTSPWLCLLIYWPWATISELLPLRYCSWVGRLGYFPQVYAPWILPLCYWYVPWDFATVLFHLVYFHWGTVPGLPSLGYLPWVTSHKLLLRGHLLWIASTEFLASHIK